MSRLHCLMYCLILITPMFPTACMSTVPPWSPWLPFGGRSQHFNARTQNTVGSDFIIFILSASLYLHRYRVNLGGTSRCASDDIRMTSFHSPEMKDRTFDRYEWVIVYVKYDISYSRRNDLETQDITCIWNNVLLNHGHILVGCILQTSKF